MNGLSSYEESVEKISFHYGYCIFSRLNFIYPKISEFKRLFKQLFNQHSFIVLFL